MVLIVVVIISLVLLAILGDSTNSRTSSRELNNPERRNALLRPIVIIGSILYFPIAVILALTKKYK